MDNYVIQPQIVTPLRPRPGRLRGWLKFALKILTVAVVGVVGVNAETIVIYAISRFLGQNLLFHTRIAIGDAGYALLIAGMAWLPFAVIIVLLPWERRVMRNVCISVGLTFCVLAAFVAKPR
jgi:hypothetical protein